MGLQDILSDKSLTAYTTSMDKKYEALSDGQVVGLCYMLVMKLINLKKNEQSDFQGSLPIEIDKTLVDCAGVVRQAALRFPELLEHGLDSHSILTFIKDDPVVNHAKELRKGQTLKLSDLKKNMGLMAETMMAMSEVKSGARELWSLESLSRSAKRMPLPDVKRKKFFSENFERMALPLEGMSCTDAAEQVLADPKGYAQKEEAQPPRKRQNQYERFINGGVRGKELTSSQTEVERLVADRGNSKTQG